ncbi:lipopolysaccharide/colanic/teichoic acid biosynthesis glycosyltransferase [Rhodobacter sp. JA431]|uniref:sugar transferase n=1 Tax=Rhodobacter sp. JA431 TaxID=570013 RepID=UPI000BD5AC51|nr:sugar transferase [Rhodobacter sp. JA431]SOC04708.1 lipopolysaccharide/colanic/teichoic acid biosynthesis glycosyltransferase [Rhodobacter sp. JA431]
MAFNEVDFVGQPVSTNWNLRETSPRLGARIYRRFGKRLLDIFLAVLLMPAILPVIAVIWLLVRADGGAAVFTQDRVGKNGKIFKCYKFRSMVVDAEAVLEKMCETDPKVAHEWYTYNKLSHDPRITRIGAIIRKTSLDELPQIFNVLKGDMSLVGPRPFLPSQKSAYDAVGGKAYYDFRPGVTGAWQVFGRNDTTFENRVRFDEAYGKSASLLGDMSLIVRTGSAVLLRTGA